MREIKLTRLAQETDLETGESLFFLVCNDGELRVPISEEAAQEVVRYRFGRAEGSSNGNGHHEEYTPPASQADPNDVVDDDEGVDQV